MKFFTLLTEGGDTFISAAHVVAIQATERTYARGTVGIVTVECVNKEFYRQEYSDLATAEEAAREIIEEIGGELE